MRIELITEIEGKQVKGLTQMKALADQGNITALNLLGEWMMMGYECSPDPEYYSACFLEAARKGNTQGMLNLALCYMYERGVHADFYAAERWIKAALEGGDAEGILLFKELYLTTIGNHKPDVRAYIRTLRSYDISGAMLDDIGFIERLFMDDQDIEQRLIANLVLGNRGMSSKEARRITDKLTEADVEGYARLQDINSADASAEQDVRDISAETARTISDLTCFIPGSNRSQLYLALKAINKLLSDTKEKSAEVKKLLKRVQSYAQRIKKASSDEMKNVLDTLNTSLNWRTKATFDLDEVLFDKFETASLSYMLDLIGTELDRIENDEIRSLFDASGSDWHTYKQLLEDIEKAEYYGTDIINQWESLIISRIAELQEKQISEGFEKKYSSVIKLISFINSDEVAASVREKWADTLWEAAVDLQHRELEQLCDGLERKQLPELYSAEKKAKIFDLEKDTLALYMTRISIAIEAAQSKQIAVMFDDAADSYDSLTELYSNVKRSKEYRHSVKADWMEKIKDKIIAVQKREINGMLSSMDTLEYAELIELYRKAEHYSFVKDVLENAIKPLDILIDKKEQEHLSELCSGMESFSFAKLTILEEEIRDLQYRDKNTNIFLKKLAILSEEKGLLERCVPCHLLDCNEYELDDLMQTVHFSSLPNKDKERLVDLIVDRRDAIAEADGQSAASGSDLCRSYIEFAQRFGPNYTFKFPLEKLAGCKDDVRNSDLSENEKEALLYVIEDVEKKKRMASKATIEYKRKCSGSISEYAQTEDIKRIVDYCDKLNKNLSLHFAVAWESTVLASDTYSETRFNEYLKKCIELEDHYYESHPLELNFKNFSLKMKGIAVRDKSLLKNMADMLNISHVLDFDNVDIQTFLGSNTGFQDYIQKRDINEYGIVLLKNKPEPLLLTNTSYYAAENFFEKKQLYHVHPSAVDSNLSSFSVGYSFVTKSYAIKENDPNTNGQIPSDMDKDTLERVLRFLKYAVYGSDPGESSETAKDDRNPFPQKSISELSDLEIYEALKKLIQRYSDHNFLLLGTKAFQSKIGKAMAAYAKISSNEKVLFMVDNTIFGSAKEGYVLTDKRIYINNSHCAKTSLAISDVKEVIVVPAGSLGYVYLIASGGEYCLTFCSAGAEAEGCRAFIADVIHYLGSDCSKTIAVTVENPTNDISSPAKTVSANAEERMDNMWECKCGKINTGNFCVECGNKKENGIPLWKCSCGSINKDNFCPECGAKRKI